VRDLVGDEGCQPTRRHEDHDPDAPHVVAHLALTFDHSPTTLSSSLDMLERFCNAAR
jgi:hypothetical protein